MAAKKARPADESGIKLIARNRKAFHEFEMLERWEAGIVLVGTEVKALRNGRVNLGDSYAELKRGELWLMKLHIGPYEMATRDNHDPFRRRKLLLNRREIRKLTPKLEEGGKTLVPLRLYFKRGLVKVEIALARGKKLYDKRHDKAKQDVARRLAQEVGRRD